MTNPLQIANPDLYVRAMDSTTHEVGYRPATMEEIFPKPVEPIVMTKAEKAWAGFIIGVVGTAILVTAGFIPDETIKAIMLAIGGLVNTVGIRLGVFQVPNSTATL